MLDFASLLNGTFNPDGSVILSDSTLAEARDMLPKDTDGKHGETLDVGFEDQPTEREAAAWAQGESLHSLTHNGRANGDGKLFFLRDFEPTRNVESAKKLAGHDYTMNKERLRLGDGREIDYYATVRSDTGDAVGVVGAGYTIVQPSELWDGPARDIIDAVPDAHIISAIDGAFGGSDHVQGIQLDLGTFSPTGDSADTMQKFASILQSFDGKLSVQLRGPWSRRAVCENTLAAQVLSIAIKHRKNVREKITDALEMWLGIHAANKRENDTLAAMTTQSISEEESRALFANLLLTPFERMIGKKAEVNPFIMPELPKEGRAKTGYENQEDEFMRLLTAHEGGGVAPGTKYGTYQALSTWKNHSRTRVTEGRTEEEVRFDSLVFGAGARYHEAAFNILSH